IYNGEQLFRSSERITLAMDISSRSQYIGRLSTDDPELTYSASFKLPEGKVAESASFNGAAITVSSVDGYAQLEALTGEGELIIRMADSGHQDTEAPSAINDLSATA